MKIGQYILSLDQGTTSSRAVLFDALGGIAGMGQREFTQIYPQPGYVEHDAVEILQTQLYAMRQAVHEAEITAEDIAAISITNQRETTVAWDSETGIPICNAIVWQCRRTAPECERLTAEGLEEYIHKTTGLIIDPYFSGTKMKWILDNVPKAKVLAKEHRLRFGTIDTWLIYSNAGSAIKWLRDEWQLLANPQDADLRAETVEDAGGAVFVPAFTGLGAPYWDMYARGALLGVTRGTSKAHICRAVLESIAYESYDLVKAMEAGSGTEISELRVDGGASRSRFLMQYQADLLHCAVRQPKCLETTALGSAMLAGLAVGVWESLDELRTVWKLKNAYDPQTAAGSEAKALKRWHKAVERSMGWADGLD